MRQQRKASVGDTVRFLASCASVSASRDGLLGEVVRLERIVTWGGPEIGDKSVLIYHVLAESGRMYRARTAQFEVVRSR